MRNVLYSIVFSAVVLSTPAVAQVSDAVLRFEAGNRLYQEGAFRQALEAYERALETGYTSGALYVNIGNTYFRLNEHGQAIRFYEKARRLLPDDPRLMHNLEIVRAKAGVAVTSLPEGPWGRWWNRIQLHIGVWTLYLAGLLLYGVGAAFLGYRLWTGTRNPWLRRASTVTLLAGVLFVLVAFGVSIQQSRDQRAVVTASRTPLYESPEPQASSRETLREGLVVDVEGRLQDWLQVRLLDGDTGWIKADAAGEI